ncbi:MAG: gamma-glutamyl-gamma-aminobutyrate hydrolase family protein [Sedimentisphaerales bacterium]|nr:gamma-glutamyl-gamma-aminobutyrate hydrolase family protein [Sedimentisphaerales bacterium]
MNENTAKKSDKTKPKAGRLKRWLCRIGFFLAALIGICILLRLLYPLWLNMRLPADAPRIAFSLDNSVLGRIGITDLTYQRVMAAAGGRLIVFRPDAAGEPEVDPEAVKTLLEEKEIDGILLTGGGDVDPELYGGDPNQTMLVHRLRDDFEIALIHAARERGLPILGICRGCQIINVALGGTVRNLRKDEDMKYSHLTSKGHPLELAPGSELAKILGVEHLDKVISLHGNAVGEPAPEVTIAATGPGNIIEAIETDSAGRRGWVVGIQWHPELTFDKHLQHRVFKTFVERAREAHKLRNMVGQNSAAVD